MKEAATMTDRTDAQLTAAQKRAIAKTPDLKDYELDGLHLSGTCVGRQRRAFDGKGGTRRYAIVLSVLTQSGMYKPERWSDIPTPADVPTVGEHICLKVALQVYQSKTGTNFRLTWGDTSQGENF